MLVVILAETVRIDKVDGQFMSAYFLSPFTKSQQINLWWIVEKIEPEWDLISDDSCQKFVDSQHFIYVWYKAWDLEEINSVFTSNNAKNFKLRKEAGVEFADMAWAFSNEFDFKKKLSITSTWRSAKYQQELAASCSSDRCAEPWASEHELGLAIDLGVNWWNIMSNGWKYYDWLMNNAHRRGFHNTYQKWIEIDGKMMEPWHWRYVWVSLATYLHDNGLSLAEYFYSL